MQHYIERYRLGETLAYLEARMTETVEREKSILLCIHDKPVVTVE